jgi:hypothetical protein
MRHGNGSCCGGRAEASFGEEKAAASRRTPKWARRPGELRRALALRRARCATVLRLWRRWSSPPSGRACAGLWRVVHRRVVIRYGLREIRDATADEVNRHGAGAGFGG